MQMQTRALDLKNWIMQPSSISRHTMFSLIFESSSWAYAISLAQGSVTNVHWEDLPHGFEERTAAPIDSQPISIHITLKEPLGDRVEEELSKGGVEVRAHGLVYEICVAIHRGG
ncbi:hypothetical protein NMY22_g4155 [Coprinellus aureogranulatus]|nr:hypothetical protein NMY22_g4155 [Coprinellus aureogranulatus]